jgi:Zn-dependent protease
MTDFFSWSLPLGRWAGTQVRVHLLLVLFAAYELLAAAVFGQKVSFSATLGWLATLVGALAIHEFAHAWVACRLGLEPEEVRLWPLGNLASPPLLLEARAGETLAVAVAGLATSGALALGTAAGLYFAGIRMELNPFGDANWLGTPMLPSVDPKKELVAVAAFAPVWWLGWFGYWNWVLFLANLIPALPMDMGRIVRCLSDGSSSENLVPTMFARGSMILLVLAGLVRMVTAKPGGLPLIGLAVMIIAFMRHEAHQMEEGEFLEEGVFGYDFSQGYTSLEAGPATARPRREGALKRWRRRRSELRRRRREAKEAADEKRMDEILDKLYREGRSALTDEEQRFLVRVSAKYKNRSRSRD